MVITENQNKTSSFWQFIKNTHLCHFSLSLFDLFLSCHKPHFVGLTVECGSICIELFYIYDFTVPLAFANFYHVCCRFIIINIIFFIYIYTYIYVYIYYFLYNTNLRCSVCVCGCRCYALSKFSLSYSYLLLFFYVWVSLCSLLYASVFVLISVSFIQSLFVWLFFFLIFYLIFLTIQWRMFYFVSVILCNGIFLQLNLSICDYFYSCIFYDNISL